ncbi:hypothetical protein BSL78_13589 [Apostichopus japonicus]|uniref:Uncharacterized protein n=1 Tax=Stichopus japonicus TaxID=307972 RepID=A0A2G8KND7_STIJA|nr:hypothetical protein BSL78_13589 [Apostichopus japonicus]
MECIKQHGLSAECSCKKVKFASCQKDALYYNRDFVARYTQESVESFSVDLYQEPIIQPTREQIKIVKRKYRNMFSYPTRVTADPPVVITPPGGETEIGVDPIFGITVERNTTCTNTTDRELFENWIRVTEMIECNTTDAFGYRGQSRHRSVKYLSPPERPSRSKRQLGKIKLCKADYIPPEQVLYTVSSTRGDPVQVMQMPGAHQDMGDISCTPASTIPRDIRCELEMVDSPKVVFKLRGKYIESENIRIPRCTAYQLL